MSQILYEVTARCLASAGGKFYEVVQVTKFTVLAARPNTGRQRQKIDCGSEFKTACGMGVERRSKGCYFIPSIGLEIFADDPNAP